MPGESRDGGAWWAAVYGVAQSRPRLKRLSSSSSSSVYMLMLLSVHPPLLPTLCSQVHSLCLHLHSCPPNGFIRTIVLESTCVLIYDIFFLTYCMTDSRSIPISADDSVPFLSVTENYSTGHMFHILFTHFSVQGYLGCFRVLATVNSAAMNKIWILKRSL